MLNCAVIMGRLTADPELRQTPNGVAVTTFTVAVDRGFVRQGEERKADFINCIAWRQSAEAISKYFTKGNRIALEGSIQTRTWQDNEGKNRYATEVVVDQWEFAQSKGEGSGTASYTPSSNTGLYPVEPEAPAMGDIDGFMPIEEDDLPF